MAWDSTGIVKVVADEVRNIDHFEDRQTRASEAATGEQGGVADQFSTQRFDSYSNPKPRCDKSRAQK